MVKSFGDFGPWKNDDQLDGILTSNKIYVKKNKEEEKKKTEEKKKESP